MAVSHAAPQVGLRLRLDLRTVSEGATSGLTQMTSYLQWVIFIVRPAQTSRPLMFTLSMAQQLDLQNWTATRPRLAEPDSDPDSNQNQNQT